ncbi:hypothetical protein [Paraburkholderia aspalathi]|uniref:hypothetical protein n=1 Tax=Paraburkholderia aspalathi TaxID=1324617 RepID=UPI00190C5878|nr:hypothetical protein [Paraburkholderia aspalathi]MBK3843671.1 hypothetical protein [Paraburkholderia aspalathi]
MDKTFEQISADLGTVLRDQPVGANANISDVDDALLERSPVGRRIHVHRRNWSAG